MKKIFPILILLTLISAKQSFTQEENSLMPNEVLMDAIFAEDTELAEQILSNMNLYYLSSTSTKPGYFYLNPLMAAAVVNNIEIFDLIYNDMLIVVPENICLLRIKGGGNALQLAIDNNADEQIINKLRDVCEKTPGNELKSILKNVLGSIFKNTEHREKFIYRKEKKIKK